jgi:hypothetical protein
MFLKSWAFSSQEQHISHELHQLHVNRFPVKSMYFQPYGNMTKPLLRHYPTPATGTKKGAAFAAAPLDK